MHNDRTFGLVLTGGGARAAYQAGAIKGIYDIAKELGIDNPFDVITGTSAGSINSAFLAAGYDDMEATINDLIKLWSEIHADQIFKIDSFSLIKMGLKWLFELTTGSLFVKRKTVRALLDTSPLEELIKTHIKFDNIVTSVNKGNLKGFALKAANYSTGISETFITAPDTVNLWSRQGRQARREPPNYRHIMASTAIPIIFPPVKIGNYYYGDGSLRNYTPLNPAIKLGAEKIFVIAASRTIQDRFKASLSTTPSLARVLSLVLNSVLLDAIDNDIEQLEWRNNMLGHVHESKIGKVNLKHVETLMIRPSKDIGKMASQDARALPSTIKHLLKGLGTRKEASDLTSYLLFEADFTKKLLKLGRQDVHDKKGEIIRFLTS